MVAGGGHAVCGTGACHGADRVQREERAMSRVLMFKRFERFWHWSQALLIFVLLFTGFAIHGTYEVKRFSTAVQVHTLAAWRSEEHTSELQSRPHLVCR